MTMGKVILEDSNLIKVLARKRPLKMPTSRKQNDLKHCMRRLSTREAAKRRSSARVRKSMSASSLTSTPVKDGFKAVDADADADAVASDGISEELLIRSELAKLDPEENEFEGRTIRQSYSSENDTPETSPRKTFDYNYMVNPYKNQQPTTTKDYEEQLNDTDKFFHLDEPSEL
eukprot:CAMPEP_0171310796 /NCGR_PEP_ID=MMETSP0816-20121228/20997_1 /TAXON_ID=420281 /ORGANISM="Proboscia inermis, Strain CCAP1064/1" /LENGTH=173 /DNA_ID=CAMNT_0011795143 /DNA_START=11 /DNA_END=532 /DNA_ORIENTATION=-